MKQLIDRIAVSFIGLIILLLLEGMATLGQAFKFEDYTWIGYTIQFMFVFIAVWVANKIHDAEVK